MRTPLVVTSAMDATFSPSETITGVVRVAWLDGTPVEGASVRVQQRWQPAPLQSEVFVTTGATGWAAFVLESPTARMAGGHDLAFTATLALGGAGQAARTYRVDV